MEPITTAAIGAALGQGLVWFAGKLVEKGGAEPTPVAMHPLGASRPHGLMDLAGNVWEWTLDEYGGGRAVRGSAWWSQEDARCGSRSRLNPDLSYLYHGFRLVFPVVSGC